MGLVLYSVTTKTNKSKLTDIFKTNKKQTYVICSEVFHKNTYNTAVVVDVNYSYVLYLTSTRVG